MFSRMPLFGASGCAAIPSRRGCFKVATLAAVAMVLAGCPLPEDTGTEGAHPPLIVSAATGSAETVVLRRGEAQATLRLPDGTSHVLTLDGPLRTDGAPPLRAVLDADRRTLWVLTGQAAYPYRLRRRDAQVLAEPLWPVTVGAWRVRARPCERNLAVLRTGTLLVSHPARDGLVEVHAATRTTSYHQLVLATSGARLNGIGPFVVLSDQRNVIAVDPVFAELFHVDLTTRHAYRIRLTTPSARDELSLACDLHLMTRTGPAGGPTLILVSEDRRVTRVDLSENLRAAAMVPTGHLREGTGLLVHDGRIAEVRLDAEGVLLRDEAMHLATPGAVD